jgi:RNA polymerase sigma-54 factor
MKQTLQLGLRQQLAMTPQLQQAIRLLQLSTLELQTEVQDALDSNYMLEREDEGEGGFNGASDQPANEAPPGSEPPVETTVEPVDIPKDLAVDSVWEDIYDTPTNFSAPDPSLDFENQRSAQGTLRDHLMWQLDMLQLSSIDRVIAEVVVDAIDEGGYVSIPLKEIEAQIVDPDQPELCDVTVAEVEAVLKQIQNFDPPGVGARDIRECLLLQLRNYPDKHPHLEVATRLVRNYLGFLEGRDFPGLQRHLDLDEDQLRDVVNFIRTLQPKPGTLIADQAPEYVIPDVLVTKKDGGWHVELNADAMPKLRVNSLYASFVRRGDDSTDNQSLRKNLNEARWFIKSLKSRSETLLKVSTCIVERQRGFFEHGEEAMKPLVLHDIAEAVSMHESTISRVTTQKYMHTPRGLFELKYFFSSQVSTQAGGMASSTAIKALIKKLVTAETPRKPLSDSKLAALLSETGVNVARRTVAKYRESLNIASSSERKRLT